MRRHKQRKGHCAPRDRLGAMPFVLFYNLSYSIISADVTIRTMYSSLLFFRQFKTSSLGSPVEACVPICAIFAESSRKQSPQDIRGLNQRFDVFLKGFYSRSTVPFLFDFVSHETSPILENPKSSKIVEFTSLT